MKNFKNVALVLLLIIFSSVNVFAFEPLKQEKFTNENGEKVIIEVFKVGKDVKAFDLVKKQIQDNDVKFVFSDLEENENVLVEEKEVVEPQEHILTTNNIDEIVNTLGLVEEVAYEDGEGYVGTLVLDRENIIITDNETTRNYRTISETRTYNNFFAKDNSVVPYTVQNSRGTIFTRSNIHWVATQKEMNSLGQIVPTKYKAIATYKAKVYNTVVLDYKVKLQYKCIAVKKTVIDKEIKIRYVSVPKEKDIVVTVQEPVKKNNNFEFFINILKFVVSAILLLTFVAVVVVVAKYLLAYINSFKGVEVYNYFDNGKGENYVYLGKVAVDYNRPLIDLRDFEEEIQSRNFSFVVDKRTTNKLFGKNIAFKWKDVTIIKEIEQKGQEVTIKLDIGDKVDLLNIEKCKVDFEDDF